MLVECRTREHTVWRVYYTVLVVETRVLTWNRRSCYTIKYCRWVGEHRSRHAEFMLHCQVLMFNWRAH